LCGSGSEREKVDIPSPKRISRVAIHGASGISGAFIGPWRNAGNYLTMVEEVALGEGSSIEIRDENLFTLFLERAKEAHD
jgi:hypothetical protein